MARAAPLSREARKEQTREAIVRAATKLFARDGIEATSLDRIAGEIGLTKGAIYSTFSSKNDLVEAVATANSITVPDEDLFFRADVSIKDVLRSLAKELLIVRKKLTREQFLLLLELFLYEHRHGSWGKRLAAENRAAFEKDAVRLEEAMKERRERLAIPAVEFFTVLNAIAIGAVLQLERDPESISEGSVVKLFESLAE